MGVQEIGKRELPGRDPVLFWKKLAGLAEAAEIDEDLDPAQTREGDRTGIGGFLHQRKGAVGGARLAERKL